MKALTSSRLGLLAVLAMLGGAPAIAGEWQDPPRLTVRIGEGSPYVGERYYQAERYTAPPSSWGGRYQGSPIDARQERQHARIWRGWQSGELTRGEMRELMAEQRAIAAKERAYLADGYLGRREYWDLQRDLDSASRRIYHAQHDGEWRGRRDWE